MGLIVRRSQSEFGTPCEIVPAKYTHQSLTHFLLNPEHTRPNGRMPNFSLLAVDAADIAAWLLRDMAQSESAPNAGPKSDAALIAQGRQFFLDLNCNSCHAIEGLASTAFAKPLIELDSTSKQACWTVGRVSRPVQIRTGLESRPTSVQPNWTLDSAQSTSINAAIASLKNPAATTNHDELSFQLLRQNCYACHDRNRLGGMGRYRKPYFETIGHVDIGDEGRLPPTLSGAGKKLVTAWINSVLTGKGGVRPFMTIRMPVFPAAITKPLPAMFARADAAATKPSEAALVFAQAETKTLVEAGRQLMDTGCVQCHVFKGEALPGVVGVDLEGVTKRVHPAWLHDFLKDPGSLKERTRMPTFFPNGQSQNHEVLNGDVELQLAAMHAYLKDLSNQPLPDKIQQARDQNYELVPTDRPIVLRTFMPVTGTHAIAVGFPQHVHFAFDAENISLSQAWRGRFLDAEGTWFIRFAPPADPLGDGRMIFPAGIAMAALDDKTSPWPADAASAGAKFQGYRLDKHGVPTFLYSVHGFDIEDRIEPDKDSGLHRTISIQTTSDSKTTPQLWLRAHAGKSLTQKSERKYVNEIGLTVSVEQPARAGELRSGNGQTEWIIAVPDQQNYSVELRYE
jgi:mono/diheme cytochrome c family protein